MTIVVVWIALSAIVGVAANNRGRSGVGWFLLALVISPLIAGLLVLALPNRALWAGEPYVSRHRPQLRDIPLKVVLIRVGVFAFFIAVLVLANQFGHR